MKFTFVVCPVALLGWSLLYVPVAAAEPFALPFPVSIGGQPASAASDSAVIATIPGAVAPDAAIETGAADQQVIVNVVQSDDKGQPLPNMSPGILLLPGGKGKLTDTLDKKPISAGRYLASIVGGGKTARVVFTVK